MQHRLMVIGLPALVLALIGPADAQKKASKGKRTDPIPVLARTRSAFGTLWSMLPEGAMKELAFNSEVGPEILLAPPGQRGVLEVKEGDLRLTLIGALPELSPLPVLEAVVGLGPTKDHDSWVDLERGILILEAGKDSPGALVRVTTIRGHNMTVRLRKDSALALELASWWPPGTSFSKKDSKEKDAKDPMPSVNLWIFCLRGQVELTLGMERQLLTAPVAFQSNNMGGMRGPLALKKVPEYVRPEGIKDTGILSVLKAGENLRRRYEKDHLAWKAALEGKVPDDRVIGVYHAGAFNHPAEVLAVLNKDSASQVRSAAVQTLRHLAGRGPEQLGDLQNALAKAGLKPGQADIVRTLLFGLTPEEIQRPETYEALIAYLNHDQLAIRHLAAETLNALVPTGKAIAYDPAAAADMRTQAQAAWRERIPAGSLPKREK